MPFYLSSNVFKQQTKTLIKHWPFRSKIQLCRARQILSQLYGYQSDHHYRDLQKHSVALLPITQDVLIRHYKPWILTLADAGSMNQIQAKNLLHKLWPAYLKTCISPQQKLHQANIQFHGACNDFIDNAHANHPINYAFDDRPSLKDSIEALGVPHPEVGAISINGKPATFEHLLMADMHVDVYPHSANEAFALKLPFLPENTPITFLLDVHLGGLARYLRMAGFDCLYDTKDHGDALFADIAEKHQCILLTRDIGLLKRSKVRYGRWIRNTASEMQFKEVVNLYQLQDKFLPLSRCVKCNGEIKVVDKQDVEHQVPQSVFEWLETFKRCQSCQHIYWKGTHYEKIQRILTEAQQSGVIL